MKRLIIGAIVASALITVPVVLAAGSGDGNVLTASLTVTAKASAPVSFTVTSDTAGLLDLNSGNPLTTDGHAVKVTCTTSSTKIGIPAPSYTGVAQTIGDPKFSGCTDNLKPPATAPKGFTTYCTAAPCAEAIKAFGVWTSTYLDATDTSNEVLGSGDSINIQGPANDLLSGGTASPECVIIGNPTGTDGPAMSTYNDSSGVDSFSGSTLSFKVEQAPGKTNSAKYAQCPVANDTGTASFNGTYGLKPILTDS